MNVAVEPTLVERTVFESTRRAPELMRDYQRGFSGCYREPPGAHREAAFGELHAQWFERLGFQAKILGIVATFPIVTREISRLLVADARARRRAAVELFGKPQAYSLVIALTPSLLMDDATLDYWLRFELQHVEDMLDPRFGYDRNALPADSNSVAVARDRDRFALLWAVVIDARLRNSPSAPADLRSRRQNELAQMFSLSNAAASQLIATLWPLTAEPMCVLHRQLIDWARDGLPVELHRDDSAAQSAASAAGSKCPLCFFPTHDWAPPMELSPPICHSIQSDFPKWRAADGACGRCVEMYRSRTHRSRVAAPVS